MEDLLIKEWDNIELWHLDERDWDYPKKWKVVIKDGNCREHRYYSSRNAAMNYIRKLLH